jgi:hypothetical protein
LVVSTLLTAAYDKASGGFSISLLRASCYLCPVFFFQRDFFISSM